MILQNSQSLSPDSDVLHDKTQVDIYKMAIDIENIKSKLHTKDMEIELLNEEVRTAYETIKTLQHRVDDLEQQLSSTSRDHQPQLSSTTPSSPHCLLLGDANLRQALRSDLGNNCSVRTIHGANLDLLRSWVAEKLNRTVTACVIYCGFHNVLEKSTRENILDNLGSLISVLKEKK